MKKLIVMLLMMVASAFASQLFALDGSPPGVEKINSTNSGEMIYDKNGLSLVGAAHADDVTFAKVDILHKDSLMYIWDEGLDNKEIMKMSGYKQNINLTRTIVAAVCYPRGGFGA